MSLYRQPGRQRHRRRIAAAALAALVAIAAVVAVLAAGSGRPSRAEREDAARSATTDALNGLELLSIEYGQAVRNGRVVAPTEYQAAQADVSRARDALRSHAEDIAAIDRAAGRRGEAALARLDTAVRARVDAARLDALIRAARAPLTPLAAAER